MREKIFIPFLAIIFLFGCSNNNPVESGYYDISNKFHFAAIDSQNSNIDDIVSGKLNSSFSFPAKKYLFGSEDKVYWYKTSIKRELLFEESSYIDIHGKAAVNFQLSLILYGFILALLIVPIAIFTLGLGVVAIAIGIIPAIILKIVLIISASIKASSGEYYTYPFTIEFIK